MPKYDVTVHFRYKPHSEEGKPTEAFFKRILFESIVASNIDIYINEVESFSERNYTNRLDC